MANSYNVAAQAQLTGVNGGAVTITGTFGTVGDQPNITVAMTKQGQTFSANDCIARFDSALGQSIAPGRVWAQVDCANATQSAAQQICKTSSQFRFENCAQ